MTEQVTQGIGGQPTGSREPKAKAPVKAKAPGKPATEVHITKAKPTRACECGCGATTKGRFAMGHDAKLKSRLINDALEHESANKGRKSSPAHKQLRDRGWTDHLDKSRASRKAKAEAKAQRERERQAAKAQAKAKPEPKAEPSAA